MDRPLSVRCQQSIHSRCLLKPLIIGSCLSRPSSSALPALQYWRQRADDLGTPGCLASPSFARRPGSRSTTTGTSLSCGAIRRNVLCLRLRGHTAPRVALRKVPHSRPQRGDRQMALHTRNFSKCSRWSALWRGAGLFDRKL